MTRYLVLFVVFASLAGIVPHYLDRYQQSAAHAQSHDGPQPHATRIALANVSPASQQLPEASYLGNGRVATLTSNSDGHFAGQFRIDGVVVDGIVDTGATTVAMNTSTAGSLGIAPTAADYTYRVETANGVTKAARVTLDSIEIGSVYVNDVDALVLPDSSFSGTLIGMNFLKRLASYQVKDGVLSLRD